MWPQSSCQCQQASESELLGRLAGRRIGSWGLPGSLTAGGYITPQIFTGSGLLGSDLHTNLLVFQSFVHHNRSKEEQRAREASPSANFPLVDYNREMNFYCSFFYYLHIFTWDQLSETRVAKE